MLARESWKIGLLALALANIAGGIVFIVTEMLVPSFVVYPILLIAGSVRLVRGRGTTGVVFLTVTALVFVVVHLPFTPFGPEGSACEECAAGTMWTTLFALPVALLAGGAAAWVDLRRAPAG